MRPPASRVTETGGVRGDAEDMAAAGGVLDDCETIEGNQSFDEKMCCWISLR